MRPYLGEPAHLTEPAYLHINSPLVKNVKPSKYLCITGNNKLTFKVFETASY